MALDRRAFLGALALAPAAVACSTSAAAAKKPAPAAEKVEREPAPSPRVAAGLAALRGFALAPGAEPAFTFRASVVRTVEP